MNCLALEFSTDAGSLALLKDGTVVASASLDAGRRRSQELFDAVTDLLSGAGISLASVDAFAVGRGPGSYTGLRVSLTAARGWALPAEKPVWTVSSGAALAAELLAKHAEISQVAAWGDARRGLIWVGLFERGEKGRIRQTEAWRLMPMDLLGKEWPNAYWVDANQSPQAEWVGRLFFAGGDSEELQPIYLHPAVATAPCFDADGKPLSS